MEKDSLLVKIAEIHTTPLGAIRISENLGINQKDAVSYCRRLIQQNECIIYQKGKNWYCEIKNICITINTSSLTIITAHKIG